MVVTLPEETSGWARAVAGHQNSPPNTTLARRIVRISVLLAAGGAARLKSRSPESAIRHAVDHH
jgi:hypothetical protein